MKVEICDNTMMTAISGLVVVGFILSMGSCSAYYHNKNKLVLQADTCEKAAIIDGAYQAGIPLCKMKNEH